MFAESDDAEVPDEARDPAVPVAADDNQLGCLGVVENNAEESVTWITSYVSIDHTKTFCIYDGPSPESVERAALANGLPVDSISEVRVLDPYFYTGVAP